MWKNKRTWITIGVVVLIIILIWYNNSKSKTVTKPVVSTVGTNGSQTSYSSSGAQIIAALAGLSTAIGGWGIFGSGSDSSSSSTDTSGNVTGGDTSSTFNGDVTTDPTATVARSKKK